MVKLKLSCILWYNTHPFFRSGRGDVTAESEVLTSRYDRNKNLLLLLGHVAVCTVIAAYSRQTFPLTICWSVCQFVCPVHCGKMADWIRMPFGTIGHMGPWMRQVVGFGDRSVGMVNFGGKYEALYCNHGDFLLLRIPIASL